MADEQKGCAETGAEVEDKDSEQLVSIVDVKRQVRAWDALLDDVNGAAS